MKTFGGIYRDQATILDLQDALKRAERERDSWRRAIEGEEKATLFADGVASDLHAAGIKTLKDAWMDGRQTVLREIREAQKALWPEQSGEDDDGEDRLF